MTVGSGEPSRGTVHLDIADSFGNVSPRRPAGLAAELAGHPVARLAARHPRADVLAGGRPAVLAETGRAAADDLSPGCALREGKPYLAWGTPGGDQQEQWALHVFLRHVDLGLDLQGAIDAPEFHTDHLISSFYPRGFASKSLALESRVELENAWPTSSGAARRHALAPMVPRPRHRGGP